jgi:antitoxin VapB
MTDAITRAMRERLDRLHAEREAQGGYAARVRSFVQNSAALFDRRPVGRDEWDEAVGDTPEQTGFTR